MWPQSVVRLLVYREIRTHLYTSQAERQAGRAVSSMLRQEPSYMGLVARGYSDLIDLNNL